MCAGDVVSRVCVRGGKGRGGGGGGYVCMVSRLAPSVWSVLELLVMTY